MCINSLRDHQYVAGGNLWSETNKFWKRESHFTPRRKRRCHGRQGFEKKSYQGYCVFDYSDVVLLHRQAFRELETDVTSTNNQDLHG